MNRFFWLATAFTSVIFSQQGLTHAPYTDGIFCFGEKSSLKLSPPEVLRGRGDFKFEVRIGAGKNPDGFWVLGISNPKNYNRLKELIDSGSFSFEPFNVHQNKQVIPAESIEISVIQALPEDSPRESKIELVVTFSSREPLVDQLDCEHYYAK